jgi:hypothetical protein
MKKKITDLFDKGVLGVTGDLAEVTVKRGWYNSRQ